MRCVCMWCNFISCTLFGWLTCAKKFLVDFSTNISLVFKLQRIKVASDMKIEEIYIIAIECSEKIGCSCRLKAKRLTSSSHLARDESHKFLNKWKRRQLRRCRWHFFFYCGNFFLVSSFSNHIENPTIDFIFVTRQKYLEVLYKTSNITKIC